MAIWKRLGSFLTGAGTRTPGTQTGEAGSRSAASATPVNMDTALQLSAVWACAKLITEIKASLPIKFFKIDPKTGTKTLWLDHPLAVLFAGKVNRWQTMQEFLETMGYQEVLLGNSYAAKQYNTQGDLIALIPLMSDQMTVTLLKDGTVTYEYRDGQDVRVFAADSIWHNKGFGNGIVGLSPLSFARNTIGVSQATENSVSKIYSNGSKPSGLLMIDKILKGDQRKAIKQNFIEMTEGSEDRLFLLEADMKYEKLSMTPSDIQLMEGRQFNVEDICRFFGVPSVLVNDTQGATAWGTGIEQIIGGFFKLGLRPNLKRTAGSMRANMIKPADRITTHIEFDYDELTQPGLADRVKTGKEAVTGALMTPNEWREAEGLPKIEGGDKLFMQQQMVPIDQLPQIKRGTVGTNDQTQNK